MNRGKPANITHILGSGQSFTFEVDEGLVVQATPTVFSNDTYELRIEYFEQGKTGRRMIGNMGSMGTISKAPPVGEVPMGGSSSIVSGSKAYAIELSSPVELIGA